MKKVFKYLGIVLLLLLVIYALGPRKTFNQIELKPSLSNFPLTQIDDFVRIKESKVKDLKPNNEAKVVWADSTKSKTEYSILYLHGFSASHEEGAPIHTNFAKRYGANLYLSRLYGHGSLDSYAMAGMTPDLFFQSAEEAYAIAKTLGEKVIIISCSTGSTMAILLAQVHPEIHSHIMYSPNIEIADPSAKLTTWPWGEQILETVLGGEINHVNYKDSAKPYWLEAYHSDGILAMQTILDDYMNAEHFSKIDQPLFVGAYYKDEQNQDNVVSVSAMRTFYNTVTTTQDQKRFIEFPNAGRHVISSHVFSEDLESVEKATLTFAEEVLGLKPVRN